MSEELTADQRAWMLKEAERHMRDYAARGVSNNAATVLLAEYDRMRTELVRLHAELERALSIESAARVFTQHWHDVDSWKIDQDYVLRADLARELGEEEPPQRRNRVPRRD